MTADPPGAALDTPGSVRVSSLLMQDTVTATAPDIMVRKDGSFDGSVALYANPFLNGQEEALAVDSHGRLTHLRRAATETGWEQVFVTAPAGYGHHPADAAAADSAAAADVTTDDAADTILRANEVAVIVHPRDLSLWAVCADVHWSTGPALAGLRLVADVKDGVTTCRWEVVPNAVRVDPEIGTVTMFQNMSVAYDFRQVGISGVGIAGNKQLAFMINAVMAGDFRFICRGYQPPVGILDKATARFPRMPSSLLPGSAALPIFYLLVRDTLHWFDSCTSKALQATTGVRQIVGSFPSSGTGGVGCLVLNTAGKLVAVYPDVRLTGAFIVEPVSDLTFTTATSWTDAGGMIHVYGADASKTLKVVHQRSWNQLGGPIWAKSTGVIPPSTDPVTVTSCVGLVPGVSAFALDPFPDTFPSQLVRTGEKVSTAYAFYTQDVNSARWSRDLVRQAVKAEPRLVASYVASATVLDRRGVAMPGLPVRVSAETLAEVQIDGVSHLVGPGSAVTVSTNAQGKVVISMPADTLAPAVLHVDAAGLRNGAVIQPAAAVHSYLGGDGTLPSQAGRFTGPALKDAKVDGVPIVQPGRGGGVDAVVSGARQVFRMADGKTPTSLLAHGDGPAPPIHGFVVGPRPGAKPDAHGVVAAEYQEFPTAEEYADYHRRFHGESIEVGGWQDFANWAGDVWQGIKNGAIEIARVAVDAVNSIVNVFIKIGEVTVKLADLVLDTAEAAARAVESLFREVVADVGKVVDWLASLFDFEDIWQTKAALTKGTRDVLSFGLATVKHYQTVGENWVAFQSEAAHIYYDKLRKDYANRPLGDARNQLPLLTDASGGTLSPAAIRDDPRSGWLTQQAISPSAQAAFRASAAPVEVPAALGAIADAWDGFLADVVKTGVVEKAAKLIGDLDALVAGISNPADPAGSAKASMIALIDVLESLTELGLTTVKGLLVAIRTLFQAVVDGLDSLFTDPVPGLGWLETLYEWIQGQSGVDAAAVEKPSLGGLLMLMAAFPVTVGYKLLNGVGEAPFPGGTFPELLAPSWHADYDAELTAAGPDPVKNRHLRNLQVVCGVAGLGSAGPGVVADLLPLMKIPKDTEFLIDLITGIDTTALNSLVFGAIGSCPPVTGTDWHAAEGRWAVAFEVAAITVVANIALIAKAIRDYKPGSRGDTSILRNVQLEMAGPVITTFLALAYLIPSGQACTDKEAPVNPYTTAMILLSGISGATQICRLGLGAGTTADVVRGGVVAGVNFLATGVSASMLTAGAMLARPVIELWQQLPDAHVGKPYEARLTAKGGDHVFDAPLKGWSVIAGSLPDGLALNEATGVIQGTPARPGSSRFTVRCSDSYGPPQFSNPSELVIRVLS